MAYMNQERKRELAPGIKLALAKHGLKGSISVRNHSTLVVTIREGEIDFGAGNHAEGYSQVNTYHIDSNYEGAAARALEDIKAAMNKGGTAENFDKSDIQTDYFHVGWYIDINVGTWKKPYKFTGTRTSTAFGEEMEVEELGEITALPVAVRAA